MSTYCSLVYEGKTNAYAIEKGVISTCLANVETEETEKAILFGSEWILMI